nr:MAG TPA: hypothetical protein [Caudoviricetes sp.]
MIEKKKIGRPTNNPRTEKIGIRISKDELEMLNECSKILNTTRANVIIDGIKRTYEELKSK